MAESRPIQGKCATFFQTKLAEREQELEELRKNMEKEKQDLEAKNSVVFWMMFQCWRKKFQTSSWNACSVHRAGFSSGSWKTTLSLMLSQIWGSMNPLILHPCTLSTRSPVVGTALWFHRLSTWRCEEWSPSVYILWTPKISSEFLAKVIIATRILRSSENLSFCGYLWTNACWEMFLKYIAMQTWVLVCRKRIGCSSVGVVRIHLELISLRQATNLCTIFIDPVQKINIKCQHQVSFRHTNLRVTHSASIAGVLVHACMQMAVFPFTW